MKDAATSSPSPAASSSSPGGKKLVQARLPFKVVSPAVPVTPPIARKRKLSEPIESANKITKPSKENELIDDPVVISDEESDRGLPPANPYLKIVDKAIKRKLQKKTSRKRKSKTHKSANSSVTNVSEEKVNEEQEQKPDKSPENVQTTEDGDVMLVDEASLDNETSRELQNGASEDVEMIKEPDTEISNKKLAEEIKIHKNDLHFSLDHKQDDDQISQQADKKGEHSDIELVEKTESPAEALPIHKKEVEMKEKESESIEENKQDDNKILSQTDNKDEDSDVELVEETKSSTKASSGEDNEVPPGTPKGNNKTEDLNTNTSISKEQGDKNQTEIKDEPDISKYNNVTPKRRSGRNKNSPVKTKSCDRNSPSQNTKTPVSDSSQVTTPKQKATRSVGADNEPASPASLSLTPKQLQRKLESAKKKEEKENEKLDREKKRIQEKEERNRIKLEKEEQRKKEREEKEEQKKKEREEKEELRRKEKEEKERQKELEKKEREEKEEVKRKEKEEKEEQRRKEKEAREEEKRKKLEVLEEEKRQKEIEKQEQEIKKKKAAAAFVNFFVPKQKTEKEPSTQSKNCMLSCFMVKSDMRLAPTVRNYLDSDQKEHLDGTFEKQDVPMKELYLQNLKDKIVKPKKCEKTWPLDNSEDDCMIVESEDELPPVPIGSGDFIMSSSTVRERLRPKLLSFHENRRPAYWGTWRKKSAAIRARRPFGTDSKQLDYEVDSDSEWEDEGEGESIAGSVAGSVEEAEQDEYEVDNDFFVPHGYLSDEEATMDGDDVLSLSPETQKAKLKHLEDEFESEMKKPTEKLKPRLYGMLWENSEGGKPDNCVDALWNYFGKMAMILEDPTPLLRPAPETEESEKKKAKKRKAGPANGEGGSPKGADKRKKSKPVKKDLTDAKKSTTDPMKNQPGINTFLTKIKT